MTREVARQRLDGWKAIADHLGKSVRTAQRWEEEHGLPVHRLADAGDHKGASVMAYADELDAWWEATFRNGVGGPPPAPWILPEQLRLRPAVVWGAAALVVSIALAVSALNAPPAPFFVKTAGDRELIVVDRHNEEIWRYTYETPFVDDPGIPPRRDIIADIDHDGHVELVFRHGAVSTAPAAEHGVYVFSGTGELRWHHSAGRDVVIAGTPYENSFSVRRMTTGTYGGGEVFIAVAAQHHSASLTRVVIYDADGGELGEYFHIGPVNDLIALDADNDGDDEIVLGGSNSAIADPAGAARGSGRDQAFLALIQHDIREAISPGVADPGPGLRPGLELAYLALPFSSEADATGSGIAVKDLRPPSPSGQGFHVDVGTTGDPLHRARLYEFSNDLQLVGLTLGQPYYPRDLPSRLGRNVAEGLAAEHQRQARIQRLVWNITDPTDPRSVSAGARARR